jgi:hypothetical protein
MIGICCPYNSVLQDPSQEIHLRKERIVFGANLCVLTSGAWAWLVSRLKYSPCRVWANLPKNSSLQVELHRHLRRVVSVLQASISPPFVLSGCWNLPLFFLSEANLCSINEIVRSPNDLTIFHLPIFINLSVPGSIEY